MLPNSWTSIYTITQIPSETFNALAQVGESFAKLSGNQIKALVEINTESKKAPSTDATSSAKTTAEVVSSETTTATSNEDADKSLESNSETNSEVSDVLLTSTTEATNSEQELSNKSAKSNSTRESVSKATQAQSMKELNIDALIELAISTAIFRSDYDNQTDIEEFDLNDSWDVIAKRALHNLKSVGVDITNLNIDKYDIAQSFCGMDSESLDDLLSDLN
jgi:DNA primase